MTSMGLTEIRRLMFRNDLMITGFENASAFQKQVRAM
jgi:hypothetical protein